MCCAVIELKDYFVRFIMLVVNWSFEKEQWLYIQRKKHKFFVLFKVIPIKYCFIMCSNYIYKNNFMRRTSPIRYVYVEWARLPFVYVIVHLFLQIIDWRFSSGDYYFPATIFILFNDLVQSLSSNITSTFYRCKKPFSIPQTTRSRSVYSVFW